MAAVSMRPLPLFAWSLLAAFGTYFCMYAFRKPFTAAKFAEWSLWGVEYKIVLVTAQVFGYMLSKFIGIKVVSEMTPHRRVLVLLALIGIAEAALLMFGATRPPYNAVWLFVNGLPLGMVFGLVMGFLEGRRQTEVLMAGLCASFIVADGVVKSVGARLLSAGVSEFWMPALVGLLFLPPLLLFAWMLSRIPPPSPTDVEARSQRSTMNGSERWQLFWRYAIGLSLIVTAFTLVTILRSLRADFAPEIWAGMQPIPDEGGWAKYADTFWYDSAKQSYSDDVFGWSEFAVGLLVILLAGSTVLIRNNRTAFYASLFVSLAGSLLIMLALVGLAQAWLDPFTFMVLHGLGMYLPYIAVHTTVFERLLAMTREKGNMAYLMYLADSVGYLGYVAVMLVKNFAVAPAVGQAGAFLPFFVLTSWLIAVACVAVFIPAMVYFAWHPATRTDESTPHRWQPAEAQA
ncbi:MAG: DUF5690 family protein [Gemmataceae bacterium]